ncbi:MAG TPA: glycosyl hydrolase [Geobacteraceae bacterium]
MKFGIYRLTGLLDDGVMAGLEREIGKPVAIVSCYRAWNRCRIEDDLPWLEELDRSAREILLTWEPWLLPADPAALERQPAFSLSRILSGSYDEYIRAFARRLASFRQTVYFRPLHEMNGLWYPWGGTVNGNRPVEYVELWQRLRALFRAEGASRLQWLWTPYAASYPPTPENSMAAYFPGDGNLEWVGLDGYNWGEGREGSSWQSFEEIFAAGYDTLCGLSRRPVMIAETASAETGGDKGQWIREMFASLPQRFPRVRAMVWFDLDKECDWRIASTAASLAAFREG